MKEVTREWLLSAESDLEVIERICAKGSLTHMVAFHAQQVIEKCFADKTSMSHLLFVRLWN